MKQLYFIDITISNHMGELSDKRFVFQTLDEMSNKMGDKMFLLVQESKVYAEENNMILEELFDNKDEAEFNKEDII